MRVLLDTSVLVAAIVESHPAHERALPRLQRVGAATDSGVVAAHTIAELYAILTRLPIQPRIPPAIAQQMIDRNVLDICEIVALSAADYASVLTHLAAAGIIGGTTYDALIMYTAVKVEVDQIITLNEKDFRRIYPELAGKIVTP